MSSALGGSLSSISATSARRVVDQLVAYWRLGGISEATIRLRIWLINAYGKPLEDVGLADFSRVIHDGLSLATRHSYYTQSRSIYRDALALGLVNADPTARLPRVKQPPRTEPRPLTREQCQRLLDGLSGDVRDWTVMGLYLGCRAGDIPTIERRNLDWDGRRWTIRLPNGKGRSDRVLPAHPAVVEVVQQRGRPGPGVLWTVKAHRVSNQFAYHAKRLGVEAEFHQLRHTYGTGVYEATRDILVTRDALRHTSVATTQIYAQADRDRLARAVTTLDWSA